MISKLPFPTEFTHAHIYFTPATREIADRFRAKIIKSFADRTQISRLIDRPIGPHPVPMFEVDFHSDVAIELAPFMEKEREGLSILVHPVSEDEVVDHTERAVWMGQKLELNIDFLRQFMAGKVESVRTGLHKKT